MDNSWSMGYMVSGTSLPSIPQVVAYTIVSILVFNTARFLLKKTKLYYRSRNVHGPAGLPILGMSHMFIGKGFGEIIANVLKLFDDYPKLGKAWFGPFLIYFVSEPAYVETVLTSQCCMGKDHFYKLLATRWFGYGLVSAPINQWRAHRKVLNLSFRQTILDSYVDIFYSQAIIFAQTLEKNVGKRPLDFVKLLATNFLDTVCETIMGIKMNNQNGDCDFAHNFDRLMEIVGENLPHLWFYIDFFYNVSSAGKELSKCRKKLRNFCKKGVKVPTSSKRHSRQKTTNIVAPVPKGGKSQTVIEEKVAIENAKKEEEELTAAVEDTPKRQSLLEWMLQNSNFSQEEINDEVCVFLLAGTDTSSVTLGNVCAILGMHQDIQQKVYEETIDVFGPDGQVTYADLNKMKYTERVIKECLRLFPIVPAFSREVTEDLVLGKSVLPAGSSVGICAIHMHRNPKFWPDPLKFDPDRFLPENVAKRHPCTFIPFSYGPRNCIGARYGMISMKTFLAVMIRKFTFFTDYKSVKEMKMKFSVLLRLKYGPKLWIEKRC